ncbi:MAG: tetratricopeptide repeat protein [Flavobacterium sp.]|jgi:tetratricopeptide (TPR) repeat protein|nr:tetratricopeptide repeat protein [Flavobacterium sp.]HRZ31144.1 tetratricopeptide repeat protein [Flavobacterium sp.]
MKLKLFVLFGLLVGLISCNKSNEYVAIVDLHNAKAAFVGNQTCVGCHQKEVKDWEHSHHAKAMMEANETNVLGDFNSVQLVRNGLTHKMFKKNDAFYVITDGPNGTMQEFQVKYTFGYHPIQQYLVEFEQGRLQVLSLTWDVVKKEWYYMSDEVYKNLSIDHGNWLHWTNQAYNWNSMCAECHTTNLKKNYNPETDSYKTTWSQLSVNCEACHGPAEFHLKWTADKEMDIANYGFVKKFKNSDNKSQIETCVRCHSRRSIYGDYDYNWEHTHEQIAIATVGFPNYHSDGQIKEEDFEIGSFSQSKMHEKGVKCTDCHNVHSGKVKFQDNRLCTQCHLPTQYDSEKHHHHDKNKPGASCVDCHMPGQYFMGRHFRRDHSLRIPRPDISKVTNSPNACNACHKDKSVDWAVEKTTLWYGTKTKDHYGFTFHKAGLQDPSAIDELKIIINDEQKPIIVRQTAMDVLRLNYPEQSQPILNPFLTNKKIALRYQSVFNSKIDNTNSSQLLALLKDPIKGIRSTAAIKIAENKSFLTAAYQSAYDKAIKEYLAILTYNSDFPDAKLNLGNYYLSQNDSKKAENYYLKTINQDKELTQAYYNLAYLYNNTNKKSEAITVLETYLQNNPKNSYAYFDIGLLIAEYGDYKKAVVYLEKAKNNVTPNDRIILNLAKIYDYLGNKKQAENYFNQLVQNFPLIQEYYVELFQFYIKNKNTIKAKQTAVKILQKFPDFAERDLLENFINSEFPTNSNP